MAKSIADYEKSIKKALRDAKMYSCGLDLQIKSLASALRNLDMANDQIDTLTETTVLEEGRFGSKLAPHPVFKIAKEAQDQITRQMKALKLTAEDLVGAVDDDPLADLTKKLTAKRSKSTVLRSAARDYDTRQ